MGEAMIDTEMITKPLLPLRGLLVLPGMLVNVDVGREKSMAAVRAVMEGEKKIILTAQKDVNINDVTTADLFGWGVLAEVKQQLQLPSGAMRILVEGLARVQLSEVTEVHQNDSNFFVGQGVIVPSVAGDGTEEEALRRLLLEAFEQWVLLTKKINAEVIQAFKAQPDTGKVADMMCGYLPISLEEKEKTLETAVVNERLRYLYELLTREQ